MKISIVSAVYRSGDSVNDFVDALTKVLSGITQDFEIVLVDDCSPDNSWSYIEQNCSKDSRIVGLRLARNFGQQIAVSVGIKHAKGDYVVVMDADLQNPPEAIHEIVAELEKGNDVVYTVSKTRNNLSTRITSALFWYLLTNVFKTKIVRNQLMMKGLSRRLVDVYNSYSEMTRTVAGIINDIGMKYTVIEVQNRKRTKGKSNYNFLKRFNLMIDVVLSITTAPLNILINLSLVTILITILVAIYYLVLYFVADVNPGFTSLMLSIFFFGSLTTMLLGIIGRYLSNIYLEVRNRPLFIIDKTINSHD